MNTPDFLRVQLSPNATEKMTERLFEVEWNISEFLYISCSQVLLQYISQIYVQSEALER